MNAMTFGRNDRFSGVVWSAESEVEVLAATLYSPERMEDAFERLTPGHFHDPVHSRIWATLLSMKSAGLRLEPSIIAHRMGADQGFADWGGARGLIDLVEKASTPAGLANVPVLGDLYLRRSLDALAREVSARARDTSDASGLELLTDIEREAAALAQNTDFETAWNPAAEMIDEALETVLRRKDVVEFPVGLKDVDEKLGGLNAGETTALAAWTGMGKSLAGLQIAKANGAAGNGVAYFSLEMSEVPMAMRMACDLAFDRLAPSYSGETTNLTIHRAIKGQLKAHEIEKVRQAARTIRNWPINFDMRPGLTIPQIEAATRRLHRQWARQGIKPGPVIIDHIGKVAPTKSRSGSVTAETRDVCNDIDIMAKRLGVPVVAMSQLNRLVETSSAKEKRPTLSSIKDSGALAENARQVIMLYRPEYYLHSPFEHEDVLAKTKREEELAKVKNHFYWLIEKNSNGPPAQVLTYCNAACSAVRDWQ
ncbi:replicative DNA helicase [Brevundimonas diminuta]|uniref:replicative DNA helicase n=1 Tax=Brevundimonas diminuta TaxID=293 RepID=UPI0022AFCD80|nr:replicative DNA helicase [Brevundimonas diminuta]MCZ4109551.1 replicative DNA helicase [Brevundimonas diminuta]